MELHVYTVDSCLSRHLCLQPNCFQTNFEINYIIFKIGLLKEYLPSVWVKIRSEPNIVNCSGNLEHLDNWCLDNWGLTVHNADKLFHKKLPSGSSHI